MSPFCQCSSAEYRLGVGVLMLYASLNLETEFNQLQTLLGSMNSMLKKRFDENKDALSKLCRRFSVRRLDLFGSATDSGFQKNRSDLDFLVDFEEDAFGKYSESYFGLVEGLEKLLGHSVDLITERSIRNPYFAKSVNATRELVYEE